MTELDEIDLATLDEISGGRYTRGPETINPALIQGISELAKAVTIAGQTLAATQQQRDGQLMQLMTNLRR